MDSENITIAGKDVRIAYCFATEIAFHTFTGENLTTFLTEAGADLSANSLPDAEKVGYAILAAAEAYRNWKKEDPAIVSDDIIFCATAKEVLEAFGVVISLFTRFYQLPKGEPEEKQAAGGEKEKN